MSDAAIAAAEARAARARARLTDALGALKQRLLPGAIVRNVAQGLADKGRDAAEAGVEAAKARPALAVGAAALAAVFLARKPLGRVMSGPADSAETPPDPARSDADPDPRKADQ